MNSKKTLAVLKKFRVVGVPTLNNTAMRETIAYDWSEIGFYKSLRRAAFKKLLADGLGSGPTREMILYCHLALGLWLTSFVLMATSRSYLSALCCGYFLLVAGFGIGHNFFHQSDSRGYWRYCLTLLASAHMSGECLMQSLTTHIQISTMMSKHLQWSPTSAL